MKTSWRVRVFNGLLAAALAVVVVHAPKADLHLEVAATAAQREHGLMDRTSLPHRTGMIFVFPQDAALAFWMKRTLIPLDMVFVAADGTVRLVYANVPVVPPSLPEGQIPLEKGTAKYVIELPAGEAAQDGIITGTKLNLGDVPGPAPN
jgi:uncharacterized protein